MSDYHIYMVKDEVDIRDSVGVYCPARVIEDRPEIVIEYLGWGKEWNETIHDLDRIHPGGSKVIRSKAWVNINKKIKYLLYL